MRITSVRYRKLVTGSNYSNQAVEAEAAVSDDETPEDALLKLSCWVRAQLEGTSPVTTDPETLRSEVEFLHRQHQQMRGAVAAREAEVRKLKEEIWDLENKREQAGGEPALPF